MTIDLKGAGEVTIRQEIKWGDHILQKTKLRNTKCQTTRGPLHNHNYEQCMTVWRPRSLQNTKLKIPFSQKLMPGQTVINRSVLTPKQHIKLLSVPKRLIYDTHCLKPVRKCFAPCTPRLAQLSVPKKLRVYCTWAEYHNRLSPSKIDKLYELLTLEPNLSMADGERCLEGIRKCKLSKRKQQRRKRNKMCCIKGCCENKWLQKYATAFAFDISNCISSAKYQHLNLTQKKISCHIRSILQRNCLLEVFRDPPKTAYYKDICKSIDFCAIFVSEILYAVVACDACGTRYKVDESFSDLPPESVRGSGSDDGDSDDDIDTDPNKVRGRSSKNQKTSKRTRKTKTGLVPPDKDTDENPPVTEVHDQENVEEEEQFEPELITEEEKSSEIEVKEEPPEEKPEPEPPSEPKPPEPEPEPEPEPPKVTEQAEEKKSVTLPPDEKEDAEEALPLVSVEEEKPAKKEDWKTLCDEIYNKSKTLSNTINEFEVMPHSPDTVCCASVKAWAKFLGEVAENSKQWCYWITKTIRKMREIAFIIGGECRCTKDDLISVDRCKWIRFFQKLEQDIIKWRSYNTHVQSISEQIIAHYKDKRVECCNLCKQEYYDCTRLSVEHVCYQLMDALNASKYWREWLGEMVEECESLTKLLTNEDGSLIEIDVANVEARKHICQIKPFGRGSIYSIAEVDL